MINIVCLQGRLTVDPELKMTAAGREFVDFSLAVVRSYDRDKTDFFRVVAYDQTAKQINRTFHRGNMAVLTGVLLTRKSKSGRTVTYVEAREMSFCTPAMEVDSTSGIPVQNPYIALDLSGTEVGGCNV